MIFFHLVKHRTVAGFGEMLITISKIYLAATCCCLSLQPVSKESGNEEMQNGKFFKEKLGWDVRKTLMVIILVVSLPSASKERKVLRDSADLGGSSTG